MLKLALILSAVRTLFKLLGRIPEVHELEEYIADGSIPSADDEDFHPAPEDITFKDIALKDVASFAEATRAAGIGFPRDPNPDNVMAAAVEASAEPAGLVGGFRDVLGRHRRNIVEAMVAQGIDRDSAAAAVGKLGDGKILSMILKYGPDAIAIAKAIIAIFLK